MSDKSCFVYALAFLYGWFLQLAAYNQFYFCHKYLIEAYIFYYINRVYFDTILKSYNDHMKVQGVTY